MAGTPEPASELFYHKDFGVKPFPCSLCDKKCCEKMELIKHLLSMHQIKKFAPS